MHDYACRQTLLKFDNNIMDIAQRLANFLVVINRWIWKIIANTIVIIYCRDKLKFPLYSLTPSQRKSSIQNV